MGTPKYLWMAVTADDLELPLAVADTAKELGLMLGISHETVMASEYRKVSGKGKGRKFVKVPRN